MVVSDRSPFGCRFQRCLMCKLVSQVAFVSGHPIELNLVSFLLQHPDYFDSIEDDELAALLVRFSQ